MPDSPIIPPSFDREKDAQIQRLLSELNGTKRQLQTLAGKVRAMFAADDLHGLVETQDDLRNYLESLHLPKSQPDSALNAIDDVLQAFGQHLGR